MIITLVGCGDGNGAENRIIFVLGEGEEIDPSKGESVGSYERGDYYIEGWYRDESRSERIDEYNIDDIDGIIKSLANEKGEIRIYAKWAKKKTMGAYAEDAFYIYDGFRHTVAIKGTPAGARIEYKGESGYVNAGEYEIRATVSAYGYKDKEIKATLTIDKRMFDFSRLKFESKSYVWDGEAKFIYLEGEIPADIEVRYENNGRIEAGEYEVIAILDGKGNYGDIPVIRATLTIEEKTYLVRFIEEDGSERVVEVGHGKAITDMPTPNEKRGYRGYWSESVIAGVTEDKEIYARYEKIVYEIAYDYNGGEPEGVAISEYVIGDSVMLPAAKREYYEFTGWTDGENTVSEIAAGDIGDKRFIAQWEAREYLIEYEIEDDVANDINNVNDGNRYVYSVESKDLVLRTAVRYGYRFVCWKDENGEIVERIIASSPKNMKLHAEWEPIDDLS